MDPIQGAVAASQSYAIFNPLDIYKQEIYQKLFRRTRRQSALSWLRGIKGRYNKRPTVRSEYSYYEEGEWFQASATIALAANNGAKVDITLSAADHYDLGSGTDDYSYPVVGNTVLFGDSKTQGVVESKNVTTPGAHVLTVKKVSASNDVQAAAVVGSTVVFFSNIQPEKSKATQGRVEQYNKVTNKMQTFREEFDVTDHEMQNAAWFPYKGRNYLYYAGIDRTAERFEMQKELAMLIMDQADSLTDGSGAALQSCYGLFPQIEAHGTVKEYYGAPDGSSFDELMLAMDDAHGDNVYITGIGHNAMLGLKDFLVEMGKGGSGNVDYAPVGGAEQAISLKFKSYSVGAFSFHFNQWAILSHISSLGASGLDFRHRVAFIPAGYGKNPNPQGATNNWESEYEPYISFVYTPPKGAANINHGDYMMWEDGALAQPMPIGDEAVKRVHMLGYGSLEIRCRNKFFEWKKGNL